MLICNAVFVLEISPGNHKRDMTDHKPTIAVVILFQWYTTTWLVVRPFFAFTENCRTCRGVVVQNRVKRTTPTCPLSRGARCSTVSEHCFPRAQLSFHLDDSRFHRKHALMLLDAAFVATRFSTFEI